MKKCEICDCNEEEVLIIHHIDKDRYNNEPNNLMVVCSNCHLKIHHRKFKSKNHIIDLKSEIFNDKRLQELKYQLRERDKKVNQYILDKLF